MTAAVAAQAATVTKEQQARLADNAVVPSKSIISKRGKFPIRFFAELTDAEKSWVERLNKNAKLEMRCGKLQRAVALLTRRCLMTVTCRDQRAERVPKKEEQTKSAAAHVQTYVKN